MASDSSRTHAEEPRVSDEHPELLHYTSIRALHGLLESDTIWATHTAHLNDTSEMTQIVPSLKQACIDHMHEWSDQQGWEQTPTLRFAPRFRLRSRSRYQRCPIGQQPRIGGSIRGVFFGTPNGLRRENGMLSQWRGYGESDAVAVVFDARG